MWHYACNACGDFPAVEGELERVPSHVCSIPGKNESFFGYTQKCGARAPHHKPPHTVHLPDCPQPWFPVPIPSPAPCWGHGSSLNSAPIGQSPVHFSLFPRTDGSSDKHVGYARDTRTLLRNLTLCPTCSASQNPSQTSPPWSRLSSTPWA